MLYGRLPSVLNRWFTAGVTGTVMLGVLLVSGVNAQITPPKPGVEFPPGYLERMEQDRSLFKFKRAWKAETDRVQRERARQIEETGVLGTSATGTPTRVQGTRLVPVLAGKYLNTGADPYSETQLQNQLYDGPNPTGTVTDYYDEISYGYLNLTGTVYGAQAGGLFQVSQNDTYYEGGPGDNGLGGTAKTGEYLKELLDQSDTWVDFAQFDNDGPDGIANSGDDDGFVDFVAFVHPEYGGECGGNNMWSHRWVYEGWWGSSYTTNDAAFGGGNIRVSDYTIQPLISCNTTSLIEIGVYAHEFGHAFGLPDLYDTNSGNGTSQGIGEWGLMASGSYGGDGGHPGTPSHMCAWSKEQLGWIDPVVVCQDQIGVSLAGAAAVDDVLKIYPHGETSGEYFLVENRVQAGFDTYLHTSGIAVWHVDNSISGNGDETHKLVDLEEADGLAQLDAALNRGDAGDVFPGSSNNQLFNDTTNPNAQDYAFTNTGFSVSNFGGTVNPRTFDITVTPCDLVVDGAPINDAPCGNNNGVIDGNERANLQVGLRNDFASDVTGVSGTLTSLTAGVNVLTSVVSYGTVTCGVINFGATEFEIEATGPLADGSAVDFEIALTGDAGYSSTLSFSIVAGNYVLIVEDDAAASNASRFQSAVTGAGYNYVHHDTGVSGSPSLALMQGAQAVVWYTGIEGFNTFDSSEQALVTSYLDGGGNLFASGQDLGWGLVEQGSAADIAWYETYLHANYVSDTSSDNTLTGVGGDPIGDGVSLNLTGGDGANNSTWPSVISPRAGASRVWNYSGSLAGTIRFDGAHKVVYMAFNFEAINAAATRTIAMGRILDWLTPGDVIPPTATLTSPVGGETLDACGTRVITWTASDNIAVTEVDLHYSADSGATYNLIAAALPNTGTYNWTGSLPTGTNYRVKVIARDAGLLQGVDISASDFTLQASAPAVTLLDPNGGESLACNTIHNVLWSVSSACGTPDSTEVYLSTDNGGAWSLQGTVVGADTTLAWNVPELPTALGLVRVDVFTPAGTSSDTSDAVFTIEDCLPPSVTVIAPNGGEVFGPGVNVNIDWVAADSEGPVTVDLLYDRGAGLGWALIASGQPNTPPYVWTTPDTLGTNYLVQVVATDGGANSVADTSDAVFSIVDSDPTVTVIAPNGGEVFGTGNIVNIDWVAADSEGPVTVDLLYDRGAGLGWALIASGQPNTPPYAWTTPDTVGTNYLVQVVATDGGANSVADTSDAVFSVVDDDAPVVSVIAPNGGETIDGGTVFNIDATASDNIAVDSLCVSYSLDNGASWTVIACDTVSFPLAWTTPEVNSDSCLVMVSAWDAVGSNGSDQSDALFSLNLSTTGIGDLAGFTRPVLLQNHPNPMRSHSTFAFYLPDETEVSLLVYDLNGKLVRTLSRGSLGGGYHEVQWNGNDDSGRSVAEGIYFTVMSTPQHRQMHKLVKLR